MNGSSQNAYLIEEEKTVLIDTIWTPHRFDFVENLKKEIDLKKIDFSAATGKVKKLDLGPNQDHTFAGDATGAFVESQPFEFLGL